LVRFGQAIKPTSPFIQYIFILLVTFHAGFLLGLFFNPENGGSMLLQNVG
jgi:hypothetical protein